MEQTTEAAWPLIYDVGMHRGEDTEFYLKKGFKVIAVEAVAEYCEEVGARFAEQRRSGQLCVLNCAIAAQAGTIEFYFNEKKSVWGTIDPEFAALRSAHGALIRRIPVIARTFADILREHGVPYYLKVDIEGADRLCFDALRQFERRPRFVSMEAEIVSWDRLIADLDMLESLGYRSFKPVQQLSVRKQRCPRPALEGQYVDHKFPKAASGLFGEEAPGAWLDRAATLQRFKTVFRQQHWFGSGGVFGSGKLARLLIRDLLQIRPGWFDIHARHPTAD